MTTLQKPSARLHHFDVLRAVMLLLIVLVHVAHIYNPAADWIVSSPEKTWLAPILSSIPVFSMPGFFMISSILSIFLLQKRSYQDWAKGRLLRVCVPLISGMLILSPITIYFASEAAGIGAAKETASTFTGELLTDFSVFDRRWIGHLWFLSTLGIFTLIAWFAFAKGVMMPCLNAVSRFLVDSNKRVPVWWILVAAIGVWGFGAKAAFYLFKTALGFEPTLIAVLNADTLVGYFPIFILGMLLGASADLRTVLFRVTPLRTWVLAVTFAIYMLGAGVEIPEWRMFRKLISSGLGTGIALFLFGYLADKINKPTPVVKRISKYSYSVYLLHYPIANALGYAFVFVSMDATLEFMLVIALTYGLSFLAAWLADQSRFLKFVFNGEPFWKNDSRTVVSGRPKLAQRATETETAPNR